MRWWVAIAIACRTAHADPVDDLETHGEELGKVGNWTQAIDAFKQADLQRPNAKHACLIGLAYLRRELWPQAELFFARCRTRASATDPLPDWFTDAEHQLAEKLAATKPVAVTFQVNPADAQISVSSFAPDETLTASTIHLAPGTYTVTVTRRGWIATHRELVIAPTGATTLAISLEHEPPPPSQSKLPWIVMGSGVALGLAGGAVDVFLVGPARDRATHAQTLAGQASALAKFDTRRDIAIGLYAGGAAALVTGIVLKATVFAHGDVDVATTIDSGRVIVGLAWH